MFTFQKIKLIVHKELYLFKMTQVKAVGVNFRVDILFRKKGKEDEYAVLSESDLIGRLFVSDPPIDIDALLAKKLGEPEIEFINALRTEAFNMLLLSEDRFRANTETLVADMQIHGRRHTIILLTPWSGTYEGP